MTVKAAAAQPASSGRASIAQLDRPATRAADAILTVRTAKSAALASARPPASCGPAWIRRPAGQPGTQRQLAQPGPRRGPRTPTAAIPAVRTIRSVCLIARTATTPAWSGHVWIDRPPTRATAVILTVRMAKSAVPASAVRLGWCFPVLTGRLASPPACRRLPRRRSRPLSLTPRLPQWRRRPPLKLRSSPLSIQKTDVRGKIW